MVKLSGTVVRTCQSDINHRRACSAVPQHTTLRVTIALVAGLVVWNLHLSVSFPSQYSTESLPSINGVFSAEKAASTPSTHGTEPGKSPVVNMQARRRVFLGIFTKAHLDARLRNAIRKTYLREHQQPMTVCSVANMVDDCDVVYAFINQRGINIEQNMKEEIDMLYLYEANVNPLSSMYRYLDLSNMLRANTTDETLLVPTAGDIVNPKVQFDFVAHTSTNYVLCPDRVWPQALLEGSNPAYAHPWLFMDPANSSRPRGKLIEGFSLVSSQLVKRLLKDDASHLQTRGGRMGEVLYRALGEIGPVIELSNQSLPIQPQTIVRVPTQNDAVLQVAKGTFGDLLIERWDVYKDKHLVTYQDAKEEALVRANPRTDLTKCRHGPRVLLGIMSVLGSDLEAQRRQVLRETYLSYFNQSTKEAHRICALIDLIDQSRNDHSRLVKECQLAYVFVAGGNPDGELERVNYSGSEPMTLPSNRSEADVVLLNIRENMKQGKSQTYLKYATTVIDEHVYFDYVAKTDSDTIIFPEQFLNHEITRLPSFPQNIRVYGGCNLVSRNEYGDIKGSIYFSGALYFMSVDLARYVTSEQCDRKRIAVNSEDRSMGNFVHSHPLLLHRFKMAFPPAFGQRRGGKDDLWDHSAARHPVKDLGTYRAAWDRYVGLVVRGLPS